MSALVKEEGLIPGDIGGRCGCISRKGKILGYPDNRVNSDFRSALSDFMLIIGITQLSVIAGVIYLGPIVGCFSGMVVCRAM